LWDPALVICGKNIILKEKSRELITDMIQNPRSKIVLPLINFTMKPQEYCSWMVDTVIIILDSDAQFTV